MINGSGKVKEYDPDDELREEGEYLNNLKQGKWKEYDNNGQLKFEGNYLNGDRNGLGKEYENGHLVFEGEYLSKKFGKGKEYNNNGQVIYEGDYVNNQRLVKEIPIKEGKQYYYIDGNLEFEGEYLYNSKKKGKEYYNAESKLIFEGNIYIKKNGMENYMILMEI